MHFDGEAIRNGLDLPAGVMVEVRIGACNVVRELADQLSESEEQMFRESVFAAQTTSADWEAGSHTLRERAAAYGRPIDELDEFVKAARAAGVPGGNPVRAELSMSRKIKEVEIAIAEDDGR
ncbi:hypothetical protein ABT150_34235 [Streptomyces mirabilis]|uniref:hypothetical protein n=1 Tax=Streptomyces mirabilis TaxID=68239 RepID=UPI0033274E75